MNYVKTLFEGVEDTRCVTVVVYTNQRNVFRDDCVKIFVGIVQ